MIDLKLKISACGISCFKCFAYNDGEIKDAAKKLKQNLGNFDIYAKRFTTLLNEPEFENYPQFKSMLNYFTEIECKGCRAETCKLFANCNVRECSREKGVDFCYQCSEFPCQKTGFDEHLYARFVQNNKRIADIGIEEFYEEIKDKPRY